MCRLTADLHTHTVMSHGRGTAEQNIEAAIARGLGCIAICDHAPGHISYGIRNVEKYLGEIERMKDKFAGRIEIRSGIELNLVGLDGRTDMPRGFEERFDTVILGFHKFARTHGLASTWQLYARRMAASARESNTLAFIRALERLKIDILAHPGYAVNVDLRELAGVCAGTNTLFEINEKHTELSPETIRSVSKTGVNFVVSSDAHSPEAVGKCSGALAKAKEAGVLKRIINISVE